jgi:hypothetical protein
MLRPREHPDAISFTQPVAGLLPDDAGIILSALFNDGGSWHPKLGDLDPAFALINFGVVEMKELGSAANVVVIEMGEGDDVDRVAHRVVDVRLEFLREIATTVVRVVRVALRGIVAKHELLIEGEQTSVRIPEGINDYLGHMKRRGRTPTANPPE